jgi:hypothetical protein
MNSPKSWCITRLLRRSAPRNDDIASEAKQSLLRHETRLCTISTGNSYKARGSNERRGHHERTYHHQRRPTTGHHPPGLHQQCGLGLQPAARPAKSSIEDVLHLPERLEAWAWRGLLREAAPAQAPEASPPQAPPDTAQADLTSVNTRRPGQVASEKQLQALYAIGQRRGLDRAAVQARVHEQLGKAVEALTSREASGLISQWLDQ